MAYTQLLLRNGPANLWAITNPVLGLAEVGVETDTRKIKIGDGVTVWADLFYFEGSGGAGTVAWNDITGTLASNTVLLEALDSKQSLNEKDSANGYAGLDGDGKLTGAVIPATLERVADKGAPGGYAPLEDNGAVPWEHMPTDAERTANRGMADGYAALDSNGKLLDIHIPTNLERASNKGVAGGYAGLDVNKYVPIENIPPSVIGSGVGGELPRGVIVMWSGATEDVPLGWALCDGTNGTPNLIGRFVRGISTETANPGETGGADMRTLAEANLPNHSHTVEGTIEEHAHEISVAVGEHEHSVSAEPHAHSVSLTADSAGAHTHSLGYYTAGMPAASHWIFTGGTDSMNGGNRMMMTNKSYTATAFNSTASGGAHTHTASGTTGSATPSISCEPAGTEASASCEPASPDVAVTCTAAGSNAAFDNRPAYYELAYIMKL